MVKDVIQQLQQEVAIHLTQLIEKRASDARLKEAMSALEQIVRQLESGNVPLDEALDKFKEGMELSQFCSETLTKAEETVRAMITVNAEGKEA